MKKKVPTKKRTKTVKRTPVHLWTNGGDEVFVLRFADKDGKSYNGFQHPMTVGESVLAPDFNKKPTCGGGIHGWPWGLGLGDGKDPEWGALWQVYGVRPVDIVGNVGDGGSGGKCKFKTGVLRFVGDWHGAAMFIMSGQMAWTVHNSRGSASNSGDRGSASNSGFRGSASNSGFRGSASNSGDRGSASNSGSSGSASNSGFGGSASNSGFGGSASNSGFGGSASNSGDRGSASNSGFGGSASNSGFSGSASNSGFSGSASNSGFGGSASNSGFGGSASNSGDRGSASNSGFSGSASNSGFSGSASNSGDRGSASNSGSSGSASSSAKSSAAVSTGLDSRAMAGEYGCVALAWWNKKENRSEMRCAEIGCGDGSDGKLKAHVWYVLDENGVLVEEKG